MATYTNLIPAGLLTTFEATMLQYLPDNSDYYMFYLNYKIKGIMFLRLAKPGTQITWMQWRNTQINHIDHMYRTTWSNYWIIMSYWIAYDILKIYMSPV